MKLYEKKISKILLLLEKSVDLAEPEVDLNHEVIEQLAKKHLSNEAKMNELDSQVEALLAKKSKIEDSNSKVEEDILSIIGNTKSQSYRFGKILVDFRITKESGISKNAPQWKNITNALIETYEIEEKIVNDLYSKFNNGNKPFTNVNKDLSITKESKQLKENFLRTLWMGFKSVFTKLFKSFVIKNDELDSMLKYYKKNNNTNNVDLDNIYYNH